MAKTIGKLIAIANSSINSKMEYLVARLINKKTDSETKRRMNDEIIQPAIQNDPLMKLYRERLMGSGNTEQHPRDPIVMQSSPTQRALSEMYGNKFLPNTQTSSFGTFVGSQDVVAVSTGIPGGVHALVSPAGTTKKPLSLKNISIR
ncbi:hypothetical protein M0R72_06130 [Candidatus Pacearchaeota archaeon]|jgi:hypothetical protein|nr:hypothetical protein [Candidatus Pacearchaeota archaeon]